MYVNRHMNIKIIQRKENVCKTLLEVFGVLARCPRLSYTTNGEVDIKISSNRPLLHIMSTALTTPVTQITDRVFYEESPLPDAFISMKDLTKFIDCITKKVKGLDHVGFCYMTRSQEKELVDIKQTLRDLHLYEMTSNDLAKWYFVGDRSNWKDPMVEFLPTLPNNATDLPYWMPHIHINIDTLLAATEIEKILKDIFGGTRQWIRAHMLYEI